MSEKEVSERYWWRGGDENNAACSGAPAPGTTCESCGQGILDYGDLFLLTCPACGAIAESGAFT